MRGCKEGLERGGAKRGWGVFIGTTGICIVALRGGKREGGGFRQGPGYDKAKGNGYITELGSWVGAGGGRAFYWTAFVIGNPVMMRFSPGWLHAFFGTCVRRVGRSGLLYGDARDPEKGKRGVEGSLLHA